MVAPPPASASLHQVSTAVLLLFTPALCATNNTNSNIVATIISVGVHFIWVNVHSCVWEWEWGEELWCVILEEFR